ncbi:MAG: hypothetical protein QNJ97_16140 [Myxococcota bacterium]|nr:hypothetical protein [Myxococcota bacterium]
MKRREQLSVKTLVRYLEGEVTRSQASEIEEWLADHPADQRRLEGLKKTIHLLSETDKELSDIDFAPLVREGIERETDALPKTASPTLRLKIWAPLAACFAAVLIGAIWWQVRSNDAVSDVSQFRVKSSGDVSNTREKWVGISAYRVVTPGHSPKPLGDHMRATDALLFSYTNNGKTPFKYLMIFAIDENRQVFWYYPEYLQANTNPAGIPIRKDVSEMELPEMIAHLFSGGPVTIYGLFTDQMIRVSEIEKIVAKSNSKQHRRFPRLPIADSGQHIIRTRVVP